MGPWIAAVMIVVVLAGATVLSQYMSHKHKQKMKQIDQEHEITKEIHSEESEIKVDNQE